MQQRTCRQGLWAKKAFSSNTFLSLCRLWALISASATVEAAILVNFHGHFGIKKHATKYVSVWNLGLKSWGDTRYLKAFESHLSNFIHGNGAFGYRRSFGKNSARAKFAKLFNLYVLSEINKRIWLWNAVSLKLDTSCMTLSWKLLIIWNWSGGPIWSKATTSDYCLRSLIFCSALPGSAVFILSGSSCNHTRSYAVVIERRNCFKNHSYRTKTDRRNLSELGIL